MLNRGAKSSTVRDHVKMPHKNTITIDATADPDTVFQQTKDAILGTNHSSSIMLMLAFAK